MNSVKKIDNSLKTAIENIVQNKERYIRNPQTDFTRQRKLSMQDVITQIISMTGGSLNRELYDWAKTKNITLTASAFVQQRSKISSEAFRDVLVEFNRNCEDRHTYRGYRVIGVDGSDVNSPRDPASEFFFSTIQNPDGYNQVHVSAFYDICNRVYMDIECQPRKQADERTALINLLTRNTYEQKTLVICDRGYESYNVFAHLINTHNVDFVCRVKQGNGAMAEIAKLPMEELDRDITIHLSTTQTNEDKLLGRRFIQIGSKLGKKNSSKTPIRKWDFPSPYTLKFRVVRLLLDSGEYETLVTSLSRDEFSLEEMKKLYHMRWDIETSFRDLKYVIGLTNLHCKKDDLILQEIYAAIIMYNYCSRISDTAAMQKRQNTKHAYKVNFAMAVHICKRFFRAVKKNFDNLIRDINNYTSPIRPGRKDKRNLRSKRFVGFVYRVAA